MRKGLTELVFILDRSGSMSGLESDTIGGFNSLINKQKKEEGEAYVTTVLFDDKIEILHDRASLVDIKPMTGDDYYVRGCTALLDAVGSSIDHISKIHRYAREEDLPEKTLFIITTDGMENASKNYSYESVKKMIDKKKEAKNWEFLFLGANIDAADTAHKFGIGEEYAVDYISDSKGTELNYAVLNDAVSTVRKCRAFEKPQLGGWADAIKQDYKKRKGK